MTINIVQQIRQNRINAFKTGAFMLSFVALGLIEGMLGPSLLDLKLAIGHSMSDVVWVLPASMVGYISGAFLSGFVFYKHINPFLCNMFSLLNSAVILALVAYNRTFVGMLVTFMANGISMGIIDAMGHTTLVHMWGKECDPFMQLLHFSFGLGGLISPLIIGPFLEEDDEEYLVENEQPDPKKPFNPDNLRIQTAYQIISIFMVCVSIIFLYIYLRHRITLEHHSRATACNSDSNVHQLNPKIYKIVVVLATAFMTIYYGLEIAIAHFMTTFAHVSQLQLPKKTGAIMTSVYWFTYTFFQLFAVFYTSIVGPEKNIISLLVVTMIGNCFLTPFGDKHVWCMWTGAALMGTGMSALWGSMFGYLENYFPITNKIAVGFTVFSCFGELVVPNLLGVFIEETPKVFVWSILFCSLTICLLFAATSVFCKKLIIEPLPSTWKFKNYRFE